MYTAQPGDILMFRKLQNREVREIDWVQRLKDGQQPYFYYHCSVAIDSNMQIESDGKKVLTKTIPSNGFDAFRPPIPLENRQKGIELLKGLIRQRYDWVLIIDDLLRALTNGFIHLSVSFVAREERHRKICSTVVVDYLEATGWNHGLTRNTLPEDIFLVLRDYQVYRG